MDSASPSTPPSVAEVAGRIRDGLRGAAPDTGDDRTQVALDDALELLENRLGHLTGRRDDEPRR